MTDDDNLSRRHFLRGVVGTAVAGPAVLLTGCDDGGGIDRQLTFSSLDVALAEAERLAAAASVDTGDGWKLPQTFVHCAQSIEYSLTGYPAPKSRLFQNTVGAAAFKVFAWRGHMSHDLTEQIPGAPSLHREYDLAASLIRLRNAAADFEAAGEPLMPHFAYGSLSKSDYALAHTLHLANHLSAIKA